MKLYRAIRDWLNRDPPWLRGAANVALVVTCCGVLYFFVAPLASVLMGAPLQQAGFDWGALVGTGLAVVASVLISQRQINLTHDATEKQINVAKEQIEAQRDLWQAQLDASARRASLILLEILSGILGLVDRQVTAAFRKTNALAIESRQKRSDAIEAALTAGRSKLKELVPEPVPTADRAFMDEIAGRVADLEREARAQLVPEAASTDMGIVRRLLKLPLMLDGIAKALQAGNEVARALGKRRSEGLSAVAASTLTYRQEGTIAKTPGKALLEQIDVAINACTEVHKFVYSHLTENLQRLADGRSYSAFSGGDFSRVYSAARAKVIDIEILTTAMADRATSTSPDDAWYVPTDAIQKTLSQSLRYLHDALDTAYADTPATGDQQIWYPVSGIDNEIGQFASALNRLLAAELSLSLPIQAQPKLDRLKAMIGQAHFDELTVPLSDDDAGKTLLQLRALVQIVLELRADLFAQPRRMTPDGADVGANAGTSIIAKIDSVLGLKRPFAIGRVIELTATKT